MVKSEFLRLDAAEDSFLEVTRTAKELVFGRRHFEMVQKLLLNQDDCTNQIGNLEEFVSGRLDPLRKFDRRQKTGREYMMEEIRDGGLPTVVVDFDAVKFLQFRMPVPEKGKLPFDFVDDLFGRIDKLLIDDESMISEVCFADKSHHKGEYLCPKLPTQDGEFICLPYDGPCMKTHTLNSKAAYAHVKLISQGVNGCCLVMKRHCEKVKARGRIRLVKNPGFINENAQYSLVQATSSKNISDGNCFSSLKAKNILRFSVIPSFQKASAGIIAYFLGGGKGANKITTADSGVAFKEVA